MIRVGLSMSLSTLLSAAQPGAAVRGLERENG